LSGSQNKAPGSAGGYLLETLEQFINALLIFQNLTPRPERPTRKVVLFGNGGGNSVLATDYFARLGLEVAPLERRTIDALAALRARARISTPGQCRGAMV